MTQCVIIIVSVIIIHTNVTAQEAGRCTCLSAVGGCEPQRQQQADAAEAFGSEVGGKEPGKSPEVLQDQSDR